MYHTHNSGILMATPRQIKMSINMHHIRWTVFALFTPVLMMLIGSGPVSADIASDTVAAFVSSGSGTGDAPLASPVKGGPLKILYIGDELNGGWLCSKLKDLIDCRIEAVHTHEKNDNSAQDDEATDAAKLRLADLVAESWDIVMVDQDLTEMSDVMKPQVLSLVKEGAGLVYTGDQSALKKLRSKGSINDDPLTAVEEKKIRPRYAGFYGNGIMVCVPQTGPPASRIDYDNHVTAVANAALFASGRAFGAHITEVPESGKTVEFEALQMMNFHVHVYNDGEHRPMSLTVRYRDNKGRVLSTDKFHFEIKKEKSFVSVPYTSMPVGDYGVDVILADDQGVVAAGVWTFSVKSIHYFTNLECWEMLTSQVRLVLGRCSVNKAYDYPVFVQVELIDRWNRIIDKNEIEITPLRLKSDFTLRMHHELGGAYTVRARLVDSNRAVHTLERPAFISGEYNPKRFAVVVTDDRGPDPLTPDRLKILADSGVTDASLDLTKVKDREEAYNIIQRTGDSGVRLFPRIVNLTAPKGDDKRSPELTSQEYNDALEKRVKSFADTLRQAEFVSYSLGNGNCLTMENRDTGITGTDAVSFRYYLEQKYGSIEDLNTAWHREYGSFEEIKPVDYQEAMRSGQYSAWLETRLHMDDVLTQVHYIAAKAIDTAEPKEVRIGVEVLADPWNQFRGIDLFEMTGFLEAGAVRYRHAATMYGGASEVSLMSSFASKSALNGLSINGGRTQEAGDAGLRTVPWESLFEGLNSVWWDGGTGWLTGALTPDGTPSAAFKEVLDEARAIRDGIDTMVLGSTRRKGDIAILFSPASTLGSYTTLDTSADIPPVPYGNPARASAEAFYLLCRDEGYNPVFVSEDQVTELDWLLDKKPPVLILPFSQVISEKAVQKIKEFVSTGGGIVADRRTGVLNEYLVLNEEGVLDNLLGVIHPMTRKAETVTGAFKMTGVTDKSADGQIVTGWSADPGVSAFKGTETSGGIDGVPAMILNRYGDGKAVYYNIDMTAYLAARENNSESSLRKVLARGLSDAGATHPPVTVYDEAGEQALKTWVSIFIDGNIAYIGVRREPTAKGSSKMILKLPRAKEPRFLYNVRKSEYLSSVDNLPIDLQPGEAMLIAAMPYRVRTLDMSLDNPIVSPGGMLQYAVTVQPSGKGVTLGRHVFRITVTDPDGNVRDSFPRIEEASGGSGIFSLYVSPDDRTGQWTLSVSDIVSGRETSRTFMVMAGAGE